MKRLPLALILGLVSLFAACSSGGDSHASGASGTLSTSTIVVTSTAATSSSATSGTSASIDACSSASQLGTVDDCDGTWAVIEGPQGIWNLYTRDGGSNDGWRRYTEYCEPGAFERVPKRFVPKLGNCANPDAATSGEVVPHVSSVNTPWGVVQATSPTCDGHYVLVVKAVPKAQLEQEMSKIQGARFTNPAACTSLPSKENGEYVFPIYLDYGTDKQKMCEAKGKFGGQALTANLESDRTDQCG